MTIDPKSERVLRLWASGRWREAFDLRGKNGVVETGDEQTEKTAAREKEMTRLLSVGNLNHGQAVTLRGWLKQTAPSPTEREESQYQASQSDKRNQKSRSESMYDLMARHEKQLRGCSADQQHVLMMAFGWEAEGEEDKNMARFGRYPGVMRATPEAIEAWGRKGPFLGWLRQTANILADQHAPQKAKDSARATIVKLEAAGERILDAALRAYMVEPASEAMQDDPLLSHTEIAHAVGVSRQAVSKRLKPFDLPGDEPNPGKPKAIRESALRSAVPDWGDRVRASSAA